MLRSFDSFSLSLANQVATGTYSFVSLTVKIILSRLAAVLSTPAADKTQCFVHLGFNSTFQVINGISTDPQKLLKCSNDKVIPFAPSVSEFFNNLVLNFERFKVIGISNICNTISSFVFRIKP